MNEIIRLNKSFTPYLINAIDAVKKSDFVTSGKFEIENLNILFEDVIHKKNGKEIYIISFYLDEVTDDNWMDVTTESVGGVNVDLERYSKEVLSVYGDR